MERTLVRNRLKAAKKMESDDQTFISRRSIAETAYDQGDLKYCAKVLDVIDRENIVSVAVRQDGHVGYFASPEEVPDGWKRGEPRDITDVMNSMHCTKEQALVIMNA